eukprot:sb/3475142/
MIKTEMRSILGSVITRASSPQHGVPAAGRSGGAASRNKEKQTKNLSLHLSFSFLLSHFLVFVYCMSCILQRENTLFSAAKSSYEVYMTGCSTNPFPPHHRVLLRGHYLQLCHYSSRVLAVAQEVPRTPI